MNSFGLPSQRVRIRASTSRKDFIRSLFPAPPAPLSRIRSRSARKPSTGFLTSPASPTAAAPRKRQQSDASGYPLGAQEDEYDSTSTAAYFPRSPRASTRPDWERGISTHYDAPAETASPHSSASQLALDAAWTPRLPNALVVSGLEHAGTAVQHTLSEILRTRSVVVDDDAGSPAGGGRIESLPDPFIVVYVCPQDKFERPPISKGLVSVECSARGSAADSAQLDRFAFNMVLNAGPLSPSAYRPHAQRKVAVTRDVRNAYSSGVRLTSSRTFMNCASLPRKYTCTTRSPSSSPRSSPRRATTRGSTARS